MSHRREAATIFMTAPSPDSDVAVPHENLARKAPGACRSAAAVPAYQAQRDSRAKNPQLANAGARFSELVISGSV